MSNASAAGRKTEKTLQADLTETAHKTLEGVREAMSRLWESLDGRDKEVDRAVRLGSVSVQLTQALVKLRHEEREDW